MSRAIELDQDFDTFEAPTKSRGLFQILWQRKAFVLLGAFIGLALGFLYHTQKTAIYESGAMITVYKKVSLNSASGAQSGPQEDQIPQHIGILGSSYIANMALENKKYKLLELQSFANVGGPSEHLLANLTVERDKKVAAGTNNNMIVMSFRSAYPEDCKTVLLAVNEAFQAFLDRKYRNAGEDIYTLVKKAKDTLSQDKDTYFKKWMKFRDECPINFRPKDGYNSRYDLVLRLEGELSESRLKLGKLKKQIEVLEEAIENGDSLDFFTIGQLEKEKQIKNQNERYVHEPLVKLRVELRYLSSFHGPDHPRVVAKRGEIETMEAELKKIAPEATEGKPEVKILTAWRYDIRNLERSIEAVEAEHAEQSAQLKKSLSIEAEDHKLHNDYEIVNKFLEHMHTQLTQIDLTKDEGGYLSLLVREPLIGKIIAPIAYQNLTAGLVLGLLVGVGLAYLADIADKSFRSPEEIRDHLGLPLVGHIPFFKPDPDTTAKRAAGDSTIEPMLCCYFKPKSLDSEAYRAVRTALFFSTQGQGLKVIQVTSPNKGDGKSLMIANLAITTAQSGKRVLLIDADCRRPRQHKIFNVPNDRGLTSVLTNVTDADDVIREACVPGLFIMGSGPIPPNPSELLVSPKFKETLDGLRGQYDYVFVDTPPLLAVTDPCVVAGKVDGLFLAIRLTRKGRPDAERAREILQSVNVKVFGIVVNGVTRVTSGLYSSQAYDYSDTYIDNEGEDKDYYYADEDPDEAPKGKGAAKA